MYAEELMEIWKNVLLSTGIKEEIVKNIPSCIMKINHRRRKGGGHGPPRFLCDALLI